MTEWIRYALDGNYDYFKELKEKNNLIHVLINTG